MTFLNKSLWASGFSGQKRSIDCGDRFGPLDTDRVHSWSLEEPKYCKLVHSQEKYVEIQPLNNWPEMSFGQNLHHLTIFLWIILGWLLWARLCEGDTHDRFRLLKTKLSYFQFSYLNLGNFFYRWLHLFSLSCQLDEMTPHWYCVPLSFRCQHRPHRGRETAKSHFSFLPSEAYQDAAHAVQTGGKEGWNMLSSFFSSE